MWSELAASMRVQHCVHGFLIPPDISVGAQVLART